MLANKIISEDEFRYLNSSLEISSEDLNILLNVATDYIHTLAGISLEKGEHTEYLHGNGTNKLYLEKRPINKLIKVLRNGREDNLNNYIVKNDCICLKRGIFYQGQDMYEPYLAGNYTQSEYIEITYIGGFEYPTAGGDKGNVPWDLKMAVVNIISEIIFDNSVQGKMKSYSISDISYSFKTKAERSEIFMDMLRGYISW